jgi:hypothetical protein
MPQRTQRAGKSLAHMLFLTAALSLLSASVRRERRQLVLTARDRRKKVRVAQRRIAASLAFATLFFAGAALSAGAGNSVVQLIDPTSSESPSSLDATATTATEAAPAPVADQQPDQQPAPAEPTSNAQEASPDTQQPAEESLPEAPRPTSQVPADNTASNPHYSGVRSALSARVRSGLTKAGGAGATTVRPGARTIPVRLFHPKAPPVIKPQPSPLRKPVDREPEADEPNVAATVWLYRDLPDPTPPSRRLKPTFARQLARISVRNHVDWALTLAVLRARGERGSVPASTQTLLKLTKQLAVRRAKRDAWSSVLSLEGKTSFADRTIALKNLYRAVGLRALVKGFDWAKPHLAKQILNDKRISIYAGGRSDIERGRVNVRVLALIAYLAEAHGQVTVSCLISGHRLYARPGVISAHIYGLAADISMLGGTSILGHQQPDGSITERAVRNILLLPAEMQPRQVISLLGLGGPSFPLANHYDHIHVGY